MVVQPFEASAKAECGGQHLRWSGPHVGEFLEDPVPDLCLTGLPSSSSVVSSSSRASVESCSSYLRPSSPTVGPTRPPDVLLPLSDPDWQQSCLFSSSEDVMFDLATSQRRRFRLNGRIMAAISPSGDSGVSEAFSALSVEEQEAQKAEWREELAKVEDDIVLMRETLAAKMREAQTLKHKLGISAWSELTDDVNQGLRNVKESQAYTRMSDGFTEFHSAVTNAPIYQKTGAALKSTGERATGLFAGLGAKFSEARESATFKSVEERVGSMVTSVKSKVGGSRSNSTQSFDEALKEAEAMKKQAANEEPQQQQQQ